MNKIIKWRWSILCILILTSGCAGNQAKNDGILSGENKSLSTKVHSIYFAGFAISGENKSSEANFPSTIKLMKENNPLSNISILDEKAQEAIKRVRNPNLKINTDSLGDYKKGDGLSAAVVIDSEDVSQELIDGKTKIVVTLRGQIVAFNFKEMKIVGSYPLTAELIDAADGPISSDQIDNAVRRLYIGESTSFINELVNRFNKISINDNYTRGIQIKDVSIDDIYVDQLKNKNQTKKDIQVFIARNFEKYLSINQNVSILPFIKEQSIGGRLSARFSNGDVFNLEIPSPDYTVSLQLKKLIKARVGGSAVEDVFGYASILNIKSEQPEMAKIYVDVDVRYALPVTITKSMSRTDDKAHYSESLIQAINTFTKQINKPDSEWMSTWVESKGDIADQMESFYEVIKKCK